MLFQLRIEVHGHKKMIFSSDAPINSPQDGAPLIFVQSTLTKLNENAKRASLDCYGGNIDKLQAKQPKMAAFPNVCFFFRRIGWTTTCWDKSITNPNWTNFVQNNQHVQAARCQRTHNTQRMKIVGIFFAQRTSPLVFGTLPLCKVQETHMTHMLHARLPNRIKLRITAQHTIKHRKCIW